MEISPPFSPPLCFITEEKEKNKSWKVVLTSYHLIIPTFQLTTTDTSIESKNKFDISGDQITISHPDWDFRATATIRDDYAEEIQSVILDTI